MKKTVMGALFLALVSSSMATIKPTESEFYIYSEGGARTNHYIPSGWMGDFGDLKMNQGWSQKPAAGKTCIQIKYTGERMQEAGWAGIYWQNPANNWGTMKGGKDLSGYKSITFKARGEKGGEMIDKFFIGGITGQTQEGDSDEASVHGVELTKEWQEYTIDLAGRDLSYVIGGFGFAMNADMNPEGATFYLDEVRLVKNAVNSAKN